MQDNLVKKYYLHFFIFLVVGLDFLADGGADFEHAITVTGKEEIKDLIIQFRSRSIQTLILQFKQKFCENDQNIRKEYLKISEFLWDSL